MYNLKKLTFIDLCAGIGGFHLALKDNFECIYSNEINKKCRETYFDNFKIIPTEDLLKININEVPNHNLLCAGFPCQPFSISGKQLGFLDPRGNIFFRILEVIKQKNPETIFLENVKNLISHNSGKTLKIIIELLEEQGYYVNYKILNSNQFGLPQNRERIIIIGNKFKNFDFNKVKNKKECFLKDFLDVEIKHKYLNNEEFTLINKNKLKIQKSGLIFCGFLNKNFRKLDNININLSRVHKQPNRIYSFEGIHPTISSQEVSGRYYIYDGVGVRKLTIDECYKIMGFPKLFIKNKEISNAYKQIGNSVCIPMIQEVGKEIINQFYK